MEKRTGAGMISGLLAGFAAGIATGILLAPKSGEETRRDIRKAADDTREKVDEKIGQAKEAVDKTRQGVMSFMNKAQIEEIEIKMRDGSTKKVRPVDLTAELSKGLLEKAEVAIDTVEK